MLDETMPQKRNYALDFYRFLFSCVICIMHFTAYTDFGDTPAPFCGGYLAVEFFFIVSGYMLMKRVEREKQNADSAQAGRSAARYARDRFERLFPQYALSLTLVAFIYVYVGEYSAKDVLTSVFWEFFMVQSAGLPFVVNNMFWYVSALLLASVFIYFLLGKNEDVYRYIIAPGAFLIICGYFYQTYGHMDLTMRNYGFFVYSGLWRAFAEIGLGVYCILLFPKAKKCYQPVVPRVCYHIGERIISVDPLYDVSFPAERQRFRDGCVNRAFYPLRFIEPKLFGSPV